MRWISQLGFSGMLMVLEPVVEPLPLDSHVEIERGYEWLSEIGFWTGAALSQIPVIELDLEESTNPEE